MSEPKISTSQQGGRLHVKNWNDFQHYKDRSPPWIKLHKGLLDNYEYQCLPLASRAIAPMLWLLASESDDGSIDSDARKLAFRLRTTEKEIMDGLKPLIDSGFLVGACEMLAECKLDACLETEGEAELEERQRKRERAAKASRFSADAELSPEWVTAALEIRQEWNNAKAFAVFAEFKDYWIAKSGKDATKTDWLATWRNWVRREKGFSKSSPTGKQSARDSYAAQAAAARQKGESNEHVIDGECTVIR